MMGMHQVLFLKYLKSLDNFHGSPLSIPMILFSEAATKCERMANDFLLKRMKNFIFYTATGAFMEG